MTLGRLLLFTLTALAAVGAIYFFAIELASYALAFLFAAALLLAVALLVRRRFRP